MKREIKHGYSLDVLPVFAHQFPMANLTFQCISLGLVTIKVSAQVMYLRIPERCYPSRVACEKCSSCAQEHKVEKNMEAVRMKQLHSGQVKNSAHL